MKYHLAHILGKGMQLCPSVDPKVVQEMNAYLKSFFEKEQKQKTKAENGNIYVSTPPSIPSITQSNIGPKTHYSSFGADSSSQSANASFLNPHDMPSSQPSQRQLVGTRENMQRREKRR